MRRTQPQRQTKVLPRRKGARRGSYREDDTSASEEDDGMGALERIDDDSGLYHRKSQRLRARPRVPLREADDDDEDEDEDMQAY